jgi:serine/threonine-protein kinase
MDLIAGVNLDQFARSNRVSPIEAAQILAQVAEAVGHIHSNGIVHCDLKPANILIDAACQPWLTDFGFAHELGQTADMSDDKLYIAGTAAYLAPEQFDRNSGTISPATDVHGLGAILFTLLAGQPPYAGSTLSTIEMGRAAPEVRYELLNGLPKSLIAICRRCLDPMPILRFTSAHSVVVALHEAIASV